MINVYFLRVLLSSTSRLLSKVILMKIYGYLRVYWGWRHCSDSTKRVSDNRLHMFTTLMQSVSAFALGVTTLPA